jgi:hypothetical protein
MVELKNEQALQILYYCHSIPIIRFHLPESIIRLESLNHETLIDSDGSSSNIPRATVKCRWARSSSGKKIV